MEKVCPQAVLTGAPENQHRAAGPLIPPRAVATLTSHTRLKHQSRAKIRVSARRPGDSLEISRHFRAGQSSSATCLFSNISLHPIRKEDPGDR